MDGGHFWAPSKKLNIVARKQFQGQLDREALEYALQAVLKKHEVLTYRVLKLSPKQQIQKMWLYRFLLKI